MQDQFGSAWRRLLLQSFDKARRTLAPRHKMPRTANARLVRLLQLEMPESETTELCVVVWSCADSQRWMSFLTGPGRSNTEATAGRVGPKHPSCNLEGDVHAARILRDWVQAGNEVRTTARAERSRCGCEAVYPQSPRGCFGVWRFGYGDLSRASASCTSLNALAVVSQIGTCGFVAGGAAGVVAVVLQRCAVVLPRRNASSSSSCCCFRPGGCLVVAAELLPSCCCRLPD